MVVEGSAILDTRQRALNAQSTSRFLSRRSVVYPDEAVQAIRKQRAEVALHDDGPRRERPVHRSVRASRVRTRASRQTSHAITRSMPEDTGSSSACVCVKR